MGPPVLHYSTQFDHNYLAKGLALYRSLERHSPPFILWIMALSAEAERALAALSLPNVRVFPVEAVERAEPALLTAKSGRSLLEYFYTLDAFRLSFLFSQHPEIDRLINVDPDLYFFMNPMPLIEEAGTHAIQMTLLRYGLRGNEAGWPRLSGGLKSALAVAQGLGAVFGANWIVFRRSDDALACLEEWKRQCLDWCYDRPEDGKWANEKYLDHWPAKYDVAVSRMLAANVGYYESFGRRIGEAGGHILVDGEPLIFYHFYGLRRLSARFYCTHRLFPRPHRLLWKRAYGEYIRALREAEADLARVRHHASNDGTRLTGNFHLALSIARAFINRRLIPAARPATRAQQVCP